MADALHNRRWISDIKGALTVQVLIEYIHLWQRLSNVDLQPKVEDTHIWQFSTCGQYTTKSAYEALLLDLHNLGHRREFGRVGPLESVSFSCGLLHTKDVGQQTG